MKHLLAESLAIALVGGVLSFSANQLSSKGLNLARNYFPLSPSPTGNSAPVTNALSTSSDANVVASEASDQTVARLEARGLQAIDHQTTLAWFKDSAFHQELTIFVDARDDQNYQAGHIPGAYQLDYYRPENYLPSVLQAASLAQKIVVYCNGGDCEDSEFTARLLATVVPAERIFVYAGGIEEWFAAGLPVEIGARQSGALRTAR